MKWGPALVALLAGCAVNTSPDSITPQITQEWAIAQRELAPYVGAEAYTVWPTMFDWKTSDGVFDCGEQPANGCFSHGWRGRGTITWNTRTPTVIRHEAGHAILWKLGHDLFQCYQHTC